MIVKSKRIIVLCLLFVIILTACKKENNNPYYTEHQTGTTQIEQTNFNDSVTEFPPPHVATKEELTAEDKRFKDLLGSLKANHLSKVRLDVFDQDIKNHFFLSEDPAYIQQWVTLLKKMKTSVTQNDMALGPYGFFVAFYDEDGNIIPIASTRLPYIYTSSETTMHVVENYSELEGGFNELLKQIVPEELLLQ